MLERADNTARLLDVKHELFAPGEEGAVDYVQWQAVLRSVSALRSYHGSTAKGSARGGSPS